MLLENEERRAKTECTGQPSPFFMGDACGHVGARADERVDSRQDLLLIESENASGIGDALPYCSVDIQVACSQRFDERVPDPSSLLSGRRHAYELSVID